MIVFVLSAHFIQIGSCEKCQKNKHKLRKESGVLHPIPVAPQLWKQVGMDLIGPMPVTARGNKYIITLTDYFSKWAEAAPLLDKTAHGIAKFVYTVSFIPNNYTVVIRVYCRLCVEWDAQKFLSQIKDVNSSKYYPVNCMLLPIRSIELQVPIIPRVTA